MELSSLPNFLKRVSKLYMDYLMMLFFTGLTTRSFVSLMVKSHLWEDLMLALEDGTIISTSWRECSTCFLSLF